MRGVHKVRRLALAGSILSSLVFTAHAQAQSNASPPSIGAPAGPPSSDATVRENGVGVGATSAPPPGAAAAGATASAGEVVVTAQKRSERLVNVPVAVTALSAGTLQAAGVTDLGGLAAVVPGMHVDATGAFYQPSIRGIGTAVAGQGVSPSVATYLDGIYQPNPLANDFEFIDVNSVDVLKGPQGTIFGRNTTAGAILVTTRQPTFKPQFDASVGYGNFNTAEGSVFMSDGLTDKLAFSLAAGINSSDGWITNVADGKDAAKVIDYTIRGKVLYEPAPGYKFTLTLEKNRTNDRTGFTQGEYKNYSDGPLFFGVPDVSDNRRKVDLQPGTFQHIVDGIGFNLKSEIDLGFATLTSYLSEHRDHGQEGATESSSPFPANGTLPLQPCPTLQTCSYLATGGYAFLTAVTFRPVENTYSAEIDLNSKPGGPFDWVGGLYYFNDKTTYAPEFLSLYGPFGPGGALSGALPPWPASSYINDTFLYINKAAALSQSFSGFADVTYNLAKWHFTLGGRINEDIPGVTFSAPPSLANGFGDYPYLSAFKNYLRFPFRAVVRYSLTPYSNAYVSYSESSKSAVFNASGFYNERDIIKPEHIRDVEGGYKFARGPTSLEASAYFYDYTNLQVSTYENGIALIQNAPQTKVYGADLHVTQRLFEDFRLDGSVAYTHAQYDEFTNAAVQVFSPIYGVQNLSADVSGTRAERTPYVTASVGGSYIHDLLGGRFEANARWSYQTDASFDFANTLIQGAYSLVSLRVDWTDPSTHWNVALIGRNITDTKYIAQVSPDSGGFGEVFGEPANFMVTASYKY